MNLIAPIGLRVNPDVDAGGHEYIKTGKKENKFGISFEKALDIAKEYSNKPELNFLAITCHIGSQILDLKALKMLRANVRFGKPIRSNRFRN